MSDETNLTSALDILGADLTNTDTSFPVLSPGVIDCIISEIRTEPTKKGNGHNMIVSLKTAMPWNDRTGILRPAGFPLRDNIFLPSGTVVNEDALRMTKQKLAQLKEAATGSKVGAFGDAAQYVGKPVTVRIKIEVSEQYGDANRVQAYVRR